MEPDCEPFIGSVGIQDGRFKTVVKGEVKEAAKETVEAKGMILFPGMINGHIHGDMTALRGLGDGLTLLEQNEIYDSRRYSSAEPYSRYSAIGKKRDTVIFSFIKAL